MFDTSVGVVVPCYTYVEHLSENLDSLHDQTHPIERIVVVDDFSPRGNEIRGICERNRVEYIRHLENKGLSEARNTGYTALDGVDFIICLDDDDKLAPGYVALGVKAMLGSPKAWVVYPDAQLFGWESRVWNQPDYDPDLLKRMNYIVCASMWRREAWEAVKSINGHGYDPHMRHLGGWEDYLFNLEALIGLKRGDLRAAVHMGHHKYWFLYRKHQKQSMAGDAWANRREIRAYMEEKMMKLYGVALPDDWERYYM